MPIPERSSLSISSAALTRLPISRSSAMNVSAALVARGAACVAGIRLSACYETHRRHALRDVVVPMRDTMPHGGQLTLRSAAAWSAPSCDASHGLCAHRVTLIELPLAARSVCQCVWHVWRYGIIDA
jgi:hypothetical protein